MKRVLFCLALISIALGEGCYEWKCGAIATADTCLHLDKDTNSVIVQKCPSGKMCEKKVEPDTDPTEFITALMLADAKCIEKPAPKTKTNQVPGDFCMENANCASQVCNVNRCMPKVVLGGVCENSVDCDAGQFCSNDLKCTAVKKTGDTCEKTDECGFLSICFNNPKTNTKTCQEWGSQPIGAKISNSKTFASYIECNTFYSVVVNNGNEEDGVYCMPAPVSQAGISEGKATALFCNYDEYVNPTNPSQKTPSKNPPPLGKCGFN